MGRLIERRDKREEKILAENMRKRGGNWNRILNRKRVEKVNKKLSENRGK